MGRNQKILTTILWAVLVLGMVGVIGAGLWRGQGDDAAGGRVVHSEAGQVILPPEDVDGPLPVLYEAPSFSLTNQNGQTVTRDTLGGGPWVAAFIFTRCAGPCPLMTQRMKAFQDQVSDPNVKLVSFSVDPKHDTPEVLKAYAKRHGADEARWHFLTGEQQAIFDVAQQGFKLSAGIDASEGLFHDERFLLVDARGQIRGVYRSGEPEMLRKLAVDAKALAAEPAAAAGAAR